MNHEDLGKTYEELKAKYGMEKLRLMAWTSSAFVLGLILGALLF